MEPNADKERAGSRDRRQRAWEELTRSYLADLPEQLQAIRLCLEQGDLAGLQQQAHRVKGTSGTYRLKEMSEQFALLEGLALQNAVQDIAPLIDRLEALVAETEERYAK